MEFFLYKIYSNIYNAFQEKIKKVIEDYDNNYKDIFKEDNFLDLEKEFLSKYPIVQKTYFKSTIIRYKINLGEIDFIFNKNYKLFCLEDITDKKTIITSIKEKRIKTIIYEGSTQKVYMSNLSDSDKENKEIDIIIDLLHNKNTNKKEIIEVVNLMFDTNKDIINTLIDVQIKFKDISEKKLFNNKFCN